MEGNTSVTTFVTEAADDGLVDRDAAHVNAD
jgi:hypothetical protein